ncbi:MAG TPA: right-handed parallel beta-helix repeat-containing protein [Kribbellaceae bacterium]
MDLVALRHRVTSRPRGKRLAAATAVTALVAGGLGIAGSAAPVYAAGVINVPADQPTIQAAVAAAASGDTILIAPGTYTGGVWVQDKVLTFASWYQTTGDPSYVDQTIVSGYVTGYCPAGASACAGNAVLDFGSRAGGSLVNGLTIQNGVDGVRGNSHVDITHSKLTLNGDGADFGNDSSGTFSDVLFLRNTDDGIDMNGRVSITVVDSTVQENEGDGVEFRMYPYEGPNLDVTFRHNRFIRNSTDGIQLIDSDGPSSRVMRIERNVFDHNGGATVGCLPDQQTNEDFSGAPVAERVYFTNNTVYGDRYGVVGGANSIVLDNVFDGVRASALRRVGGASISSYNLFWGNGLNAEESVVDTTTSVYGDPLLASDQTLSSGSPAIDTGTASYQWNGEQVLSIPSSDYSGTAPDLGFSEFVSGGPPVNHAPTVNAGTDASIMLPNTAALDGTVTDDGLPGGTLSTTWSQVSGPGTTTFGNPGAVDTSASFSAAGTYVLQLTASDGALAASDTVQITVAPAPAPGSGSVASRIATSTDDVEESATGSYAATSTDLELVYDGSNQKVGLRFPGLAIPVGASITGAYVQFEADEKQSEATALTIQGQAADNAAAFTSATKPSTRARTSAATTWSPAAWTVIGEAGANQRTPDLSAVVQEILSRPGWASGNAIALIITGTGHRTTRAFDGKAAGAALLHVDYSTGGPPPNQAPVVNAGPDATIMLPSSASLDGTVTDDGQPGPVTTAWSQVSGPGTTTFGNPAAVDTTASFSAAGTYVLQLSASDGALSAGDTVQITVQAAPAPGSGSAEVRIAASSDDAEESATGSYYGTSSDLELVYDGNNQVVGLRFPGLAIPAGATITNAYIQFEADETQSEATTLTIQGQAADNAVTFSSATKPSTRPRTTASATWSPPAWTLVGETGPSQRTPGLAAIVQEIVSRPGWASGNALAVIITGTGHRTTRAYDGKPAGAPLLHIDYTTG